MPDNVELFYDVLVERGLTDADVARINWAFKLWIEHKPWYPTPADIIENLPRSVHREAPRLPYNPERSEEVGLKAIAEMKTLLT